MLRRKTILTLIAIPFICILLWIFRPRFYGGESPTAHERRNRRICQQNLRAIWMASQFYFEKTGSDWPGTLSELQDALCPKYFALGDFRCAAYWDLPKSYTEIESYSSYIYTPPPLGEEEPDPKTIILRDKPENHDLSNRKIDWGYLIFAYHRDKSSKPISKNGINVLRLDGTVEWIPTEGRNKP